ncbi:hypothetical protein L7F22_006778 [Adiantum nelumboides]|nr:hypothetical protein [Adiantum nelumboides]
MAPLAKRTASSFSEQALSEEGRGRGSSGSFSSLSFCSQVIDDVEDDVETSRGKRSCRRRLSFDDSNASGCSTTSSAGLQPLNKVRRSARSIHSSANARRQSTPCRSWRVVLQSLAELWIEQQVASCGGDDKDWIEVLSEKLSSTEEQLDILELDGMELLDHDQELALALFQDPDAFATELMDYILRLLSSTELWSRKGWHSRTHLVDAQAERGSRLWIRFTSVPLPLLPLHVLQHRSSELTYPNNAENGSPKQRLVYVYGVVYAISSIARTYPPACFKVFIQMKAWFPWQEILLGPVPNVAAAVRDPDAVNAFASTLVSVSLFDDLTGRLQIGDSVALIGHATMHCAPLSTSGPLPPSKYRFADVQIKANNIFVPFDLNSLKVLANVGTSQAFCKKNGEVSIEKLCNELCCHGPGIHPWPKLLPIALLLSIVATNSSLIDDHQHIPQPSGYRLLEAPNTTITGESGITSRKQIHILIACKSFSSASILRSLQAASMYASRSVYDAGSNRTLVAKVRQDDASKDKQMLHAGCISLSKEGVLIVDLSLLTMPKTNQLCEAMDRRYGKSQQHKLDQVSKSTTIWGFSYGNSQKCSSRGTADSKIPSLPPALMRGFDIVLEEPSGMLSNSDFVQSLVMGFNKSTDNSGFSDDLQQHILAASNISSFSIRVEAHDLLCSYYLALRRNKEYSDARSECVDDASLLTLESLLRVSEACAKLCLSSEVREVAARF